MISYTNADAVEQIASAIEAGFILLGRRATCGKYKLAVDDYDGFAVIPTSRTQAQESEHRDAADAAPKRYYRTNNGMGWIEHDQPDRTKSAMEAQQ